MLFPVEYHLEVRDFLAEESSWGWIENLLVFCHDSTTLYNSFPSMHVAGPWFLYRVAQPEFGKLKPFVLLVTLLVAFSTIFVKIHYLADVVMGFALAELVYRGGYLNQAKFNLSFSDKKHKLVYSSMTGFVVFGFVWI